MISFPYFYFTILMSLVIGHTSTLLEIWDSHSEAINGDPKFDKGCFNKTLKAYNPNFYMCLRQDSDLVSKIIREEGRWDDCDPLLTIWKHLINLNDSKDMNSSLFVDAGANIGSCSLLMASAGINVLSFEPLPSNLFYFTRSIKKNIELGVFPVNRINVIPFGLGNKSEMHTIYSERGNLGNSVINNPVASTDDPTQISAMHNNNKTIKIVRLDDVLWPNMQLPPPNIRLMKLDIQGFEIQMLHGAHNLLKARSIQTIKTELAGKHLQAQGGSALGLCILLKEYGFELFRDHQMKHRIKTSFCARYDRMKSEWPDITARLS
mmetsp:Transcript_20117/g.19420  ORF Transcript_20117/g.19420 Transcript_20117/m.19420 type:complete len:321 (-) Transcript_20117:114-1076(-)